MNPLLANAAVESLECRVAFAFEHAAAPAEFMFLPAGKHTITAHRAGKPVTVTLRVDAATAGTLNAALEAQRAESEQKPFMDFDHKKEAASFWPSAFTWREGQGILCSGEWSQAGAAAIQGKAYRSFSPAIFLNKYTHEPASPAVITGAPLCMGGLVNDPAFKAMKPLFASNGGETTGAVATVAVNPHIEDTMKESLLLNQHGADGGGGTATAAAPSAADALHASNRITQLEGELKARRASDAKAAVARAVTRGAVPIKDTETQAALEASATENAAFLKAIDALPGAPALQAGRVTHAPVVQVTGEDPIEALKAYVAERDPLKQGRIYRREFSPLLAKGGELDFSRVPLEAANSLGTLVGSIVTGRVLDLLKFQLPALSRISTDFSAEQVKYNQTVLSTYNSVPSVGTYNTSTGYPTADATGTDVSVTINQHKCVQHVFQANELGGTARRLFDEFAPAAAYALAKDLVDYVYSLVTTAAFTNAQITKAQLDFGRDTVIDIGSAQDDSGVPDFERTLILSTAYYGALRKDPTIAQLATYQQAGIITKGVLPDVEGYMVVKAPNLPATGNLRGFAFNKSALVAATRLPLDYSQVLPGASNGSVSQVVNPDNGAAMVQTMFVNHTLGTANWRIAWMYGSAVGQQSAGLILRSAV